jgi:hypothetical protein
MRVWSALAVHKAWPYTWFRSISSLGYEFRYVLMAHTWFWPAPFLHSRDGNGGAPIGEKPPDGGEEDSVSLWG